MAEVKKHISFWFQPYDIENNLHVVEKTDENGNKRRYLKGITSGIRVDGHGERMTKNCIKSMQEQANAGEILLFEGQHGVNLSDDIGRLVEANITPEGDWLTVYRLYDEQDGFAPGSPTLEKADKLWKQVNGLPPYTKPMPRGFSIEGYIPDNGILELDESTGVRTQIDNVELDGVVVTNRPSYKTSIATAIRKALGELSPEARTHISDNIRGKFINLIADEEIKNSYYSKKFKLDDALSETIEEIMNNGYQIKDRLTLVLDEYSRMLIQVILEHSGMFRRPPEEPDLSEQDSIALEKSRRLTIWKNIEGQLAALVERRIHSKTAGKKTNKTRGKKHDNHNRQINTRRKTAN